MVKSIFAIMCGRYSNEEWVRRGISLPEVAKWAGHEDIAFTMDCYFVQTPGIDIQELKKVANISTSKTGFLQMDMSEIPTLRVKFGTGGAPHI